MQSFLKHGLLVLLMGLMVFVNTGCGGSTGSGADNNGTSPPLPTPPATAGTYPADLLNLTHWKLQLPMDTNHDGNPDEIKQTQLASYAIDPFFILNAAKNGVIFQAHCGGAIIPGSNYPRSELREMANSGGTPAGWSTNSGTHTMYIKQAITHLPVMRPQIVVGQIHDAGAFRIFIRLNGTQLLVRHSDGDGIPDTVLATNYQLGTVFTIKFVAAGGHVKTYYNDGAVPVDDYPLSASGCYFKAGCYIQSNTNYDDPNAYGQVIIYDLRVSHE